MLIKTISARFGALMAGGLMLCTASAANASLINDSITGTGLFLSPSPGPVVVGGGTEFNITFGTSNNIAVDIGADTITFMKTAGDLIGLGGGWIYTFSDLHWTDDPDAGLGGVEITSSTLIGFDLSDISFSEHEVIIDLTATDGWGGLSSNGGFTLTLSHDVPEPATLAIFGIGLAGLGFARRRRRIS